MKKKYERPSVVVEELQHNCEILAGSGSYTDPESTPPNEISNYDDWLE